VTGGLLRDAVERVGEIRRMPVLLTSVMAMCGLFPLALFRAPLYVPFVCVIIGGLISSTLRSRIVTPAMSPRVARRTTSRRISHWVASDI